MRCRHFSAARNLLGCLLLRWLDWCGLTALDRQIISFRSLVELGLKLRLGLELRRNLFLVCLKLPLGFLLPPVQSLVSFEHSSLRSLLPLRLRVEFFLVLNRRRALEEVNGLGRFTIICSLGFLLRLFHYLTEPVGLLFPVQQVSGVELSKGTAQEKLAVGKYLVASFREVTSGQAFLFFQAARAETLFYQGIFDVHSLLWGVFKH